MPSDLQTRPRQLLDEITPVLDGGYCVGCGACSFACPSGITMQRNTDGAMEAVITNADSVSDVAAGVCPFSDATPDENALASTLFPGAQHQDEKLGRFDSTFAGHVQEAALREIGSSGGLTTWMAEQLLKQGLVDAVVHAHPVTDAATDTLFAYDVSRQVADLRAGAKTRYYSVHFADALREVTKNNERIALIGVPCFIKAARHLAQHDAVFARSMTYGIALICGHMKASGFAESLAWQSGVKPRDIKTVDFRLKLPGRAATHYGFETESHSHATPIQKPMSDLVGRNWDGGFFKLKACEFCDDVVGETADISFGDAWLQKYASDYKGTNVIVVRNPELTAILENAAAQGDLSLDVLTPDQVIASQSAGFRDRREGLAYRLHLADIKGRWRPKKRVQPSKTHLTLMRRITIKLRGWTRRRSFASYRFSKRLGHVAPYKAEMISYHAGLKVLGLIERKLNVFKK